MNEKNAYDRAKLQIAIGEKARAEPSPHAASRSQSIARICVNVGLIVRHRTEQSPPDVTPRNQAPLHEVAVVLIKLLQNAQHEKKRKAGYVADLATAEAGGTDDIIEGGVLPMLAKVYEDRADKVTFPVAVQPKLDGHRCIAVVEFDVLLGVGASVETTLWSRYGRTSAR